MSRLNNFEPADGVKLYPAEFRHQIRQARIVTNAVMFLLAMFKLNTPKPPRNQAGFGHDMLGHASHRTV